jgi:hypothetical protein
MTRESDDLLEHSDAAVIALGWNLRERLALATARRILTEIAQHAKIGDEYHDAIVDLARAWVEMYG